MPYKVMKTNNWPTVNNSLKTKKDTKRRSSLAFLNLHYGKLDNTGQIGYCRYNPPAIKNSFLFHRFFNTIPEVFIPKKIFTVANSTARPTYSKGKLVFFLF